MASAGNSSAIDTTTRSHHVAGSRQPLPLGGSSCVVLGKRNAARRALLRLKCGITVDQTFLPFDWDDDSVFYRISKPTEAELSIYTVFELNAN